MEFPLTQWTILVRADLASDPAAKSAMAYFCENYRRPIIQFLLRRGILRDRVEDLAHDFMLALMEDATLRKIARNRGRFRNFLLTALRRFIANRVAKDHAEKRGGGQSPLSLDLDHLGDQIPDPADPEVRQHDREWAITLFLHAFDRLVEESEAKGKKQRVEVLRPFLLPGNELPSYESVATTLGLSEVAVRTEVSRLRDRLRELFRDEVATTVECPTEIDAEIQHLRNVLRHPGTEFGQGPEPGRTEPSS